MALFAADYAVNEEGSTLLEFRVFVGAACYFSEYPFLSFFFPNLSQAVRSQLGAAIPRENAFQVQAAHPPDALRGFEIAHIPNVFPNYIRFAAGYSK